MSTTKRPARKPQGMKRGRFLQRSHAAVVWANNPLGFTILEAWKNNRRGYTPDLNPHWQDEEWVIMGEYRNIGFCA